MPERIQRRRTKGWRLPPDTIYAGRPTQWANWLKVGPTVTPEQAVEYFCADIEERIELGDADMRPLRGKNLACYCPLCNRHREGKPLSERCPECAPCHVDVLGELLLEIANA